MLKPKALSILGLSLALVLTLGGRASADLSFYLDTPNSQMSGFTGPYVEVTVHLINSTDAKITFTSLTNGGYTYYLTDSNSVAVNVNATNFSAALDSYNSQNATVTFTATTTSSQNVDHQGYFNLTGDAGSSSSQDIGTQLAFTVSATGVNWTSASDVLTTSGNGSNLVAASHVNAIVAGDPITTTSSGTGYVGGDGTSNPPPPTSTPEPSTILIAALGTMGFLGYGLRRHRKS